jgi:hypothetical protein
MFRNPVRISRRLGILVLVAAALALPACGPTTDETTSPGATLETGATMAPTVEMTLEPGTEEMGTATP